MLPFITSRFTVCTSLGQLVNKERLHETMAKMKLSEELRKVEAAKEAAAIEREISLRRKQVEEQLQAKKRREEEMRKLKVRYYFVILFSNQLHMSPNYCDHCICRT